MEHSDSGPQTLKHRRRVHLLNELDVSLFSKAREARTRPATNKTNNSSFLLRDDHLQTSTAKRDTYTSPISLKYNKKTTEKPTTQKIVEESRTSEHVNIHHVCLSPTFLPTASLHFKSPYFSTLPSLSPKARGPPARPRDTHQRRDPLPYFLG